MDEGIDIEQERTGKDTRVEPVLQGQCKMVEVALAQGNQGPKPSNTLSEEPRRKVRGLAQGVYAGLSHSRPTEKLRSQGDLQLRCSTLRRILIAEGLRSQRPGHWLRRPLDVLSGVRPVPRNSFDPGHVGIPGTYWLRIGRGLEYRRAEYVHGSPQLL